MFSVSDKGSRITGLAPGRPAWRRAPRLLVAALLCFAAQFLRRCAMRGYAGTVRLGEVGFWLHNDPKLDVTVTYDLPAGLPPSSNFRSERSGDVVRTH